MNAEELRVGMIVEVDPGEHRDNREARILEVPPWTQEMLGEEIERTDSIFVEYGGTSHGAFGNMRERIDIENILEVK